MTEPPLIPGITFTQPSQWVWHVSLDGKRVGTVNGDSVLGFTARDINHQSIGRGYVSAEAAMQAWVPATDSLGRLAAAVNTAAAMPSAMSTTSANAMSSAAGTTAGGCAHQLQTTTSPNTSGAPPVATS